MEGNDGGGETIVVHGLKASGCGYDEEKRNGYVCAEFHKVDLKEEVEKNFYPELVIWSGRGKMLRTGPKLYLARLFFINFQARLDSDKIICTPIST